MDTHLRIGVVEDNDDLRASLVEVLQGVGHKVTGFSCAEDLDDSAAEAFDLMILDLNLPGEDGLSLAERLKHAQPNLRVIMMTTRTTLDDRVKGYDVGADLYLPKPAVEEELLAAVRAMARQIHSDSVKSADERETLLRVDAHAMELRGPQGVTPLNPVDVAVLSALARAPGQRLEHWQLITALGLESDEGNRSNLAVRMTRLRGKLSQVGCDGGALRSLRAEGYQLCVAVAIE